ncbi:MAG: anion permease [Deltaproteobacteria bacterium]|jgi:anion transporter|nr:anion permease [Deltaproteobacteria bacterium]
MEDSARTEAPKRMDPALLIMGIVLVLAITLMLLPTPAGLSRAGQKVLGIAIIAIGLWGTEVLPVGVTGILVVIALMVSGSVSTYQEALIGFAKPVAYFLIAVLTIGLAVQKSGLAERSARVFLRYSRARPLALFAQMLAAFPLLTLLLPSATTRSGILVHVYEQVLILSKVPPEAPLSKAIMMALNSVNRLASTAILTGGITPVLSAALVGGMYWSRWLVLMLVPYLALLVLGSLLIYALYHRGFKQRMEAVPVADPKPFSKMEIRTIIITLGASVLWLTDSFHHLDPSLPALLAWALLLTPKIGVLTWKEFERNLGWSNFFVIASSMSLAHALIKSGAGLWLANSIVNQVPSMSQYPLLVVMVLLCAAAPIRLLIPNITGFLAITIPIAMSIGTSTGLNPIVCGLLVMIAGDAVLYYPAQSASSLVVYERGHLTAAEIFRFGLLMTLAAFIVVVVVAIPYWSIVGEALVVK